MVKKTVGVVGTEFFQRPIWKCFSFEEICEGTDGFSSDNLVGKGGYVEVYKGVLRNGDEIAVKRPTSSGPITLRFQATASLGYTYWVRSTNAIPKVWKSGAAYEATAKLITK